MWQSLINATQAVADAPADLSEFEFDALSDRRLDALDHVMALDGPGAETVRRLVGAGVDLEPEMIRAICRVSLARTREETDHGLPEPAIGARPGKPWR